MLDPSPTRWRNVAVLSGTILFTLTGLFSWNRLTSIYLRNLGASDLDIGWAMLLLSFAHRLPQLIGGYLADRFGRRRIVGIVTLLMAVCYAAIGLAPTWQLMIAANMVCWIIGAIQWPAMLLLVAESVPEHKRGRAIAILETASMTGVTLGYLFGSGVLARIGLMEGGWKILCLTTAALYLGAAVVRTLGLVETGAVTTTRPFLAQLGALSWKLIALPCVVMILAATAFNVTLDGPLREIHLKDVSGFSDARIDLFNFYGGLVSLPLAVAAGWLSDRWGSARVILAACLISAGMTAGFLLPDGRAFAPALFIALMVPQELFTVSWHKLITTIAPAANRGLYVSMAGLLAGLVIPWSNPLTMALYSPKGSAPFVLALILALLGAGAAAFLAMKKAPEPVMAPAPK